MTSLTSFSGSVPQNYETYLGPLFFEPYALDLAERLPDKENMRNVLEIACGTGRLTNHLTANLSPDVKLVATDLNPDMLKVAEQIISAGNVQWQIADAHKLPFENKAFDAVVCQYGVMFFQDKSKAFDEINRVLKPGGVFLFNTWDELKYNALAGMAQTVLEELYPNDPPHFLDKGPYSFFNKTQIKTLLTGAGLSEIHIEVVAKTTMAANPDDAVTGILEGTPNYAYIAQRNLPVTIVKEKLKVRLVHGFGEKNLPLPMQALVVEAKKSE
ncbi:MAG: class I SAM-dependent methyltransferase [Chitinophagaceae bacterium]|nr:MAG: class I SAM-dependent methyltransferase [Chitinophagaceae bacterium]